MRKLLWLMFFLGILATPTFSQTLNLQPVEVDYIFPTIGTVFEVLGTGTVTTGGFTVNSFGQTDFTVTPSQVVLTNVFGSPVISGLQVSTDMN